VFAKATYSYCRLQANSGKSQQHFGYVSISLLEPELKDAKAAV